MKFCEMCTLMFNSIHFLTLLFCSPTWLWIKWRGGEQIKQHTEVTATHLRKAESKKLSSQRIVKLDHSVLAAWFVTLSPSFPFFFVRCLECLMMCIGPDRFFRPILFKWMRTHTDFLKKIIFILLLSHSTFGVLFCWRGYMVKFM